MTRGLALALTALTGFSGLVYEVAWEKTLATLLGSHSEATAAVLGIFLGGLSLGYSIFGRVTRGWMAAGRGARLLVLYGVVEGSIGLYVLAFPWLFQGAVRVSAWLPSGVGGVGFAVDVGLAGLLIGPPTVLMGGTIPILTQALSRGTADATRFHALIYALNTAGAFVGALAAGFLLIPALGLVRVMSAMGLVNLGAGVLFGVLGLRRRPAIPVLDEPEEEPAVRGFGTYAGAALLVGFAMMSLQTVLIRIGGLSLGASQFTFSMVVATFVLCIALGSLVVSALPRIPSYALAVNQWLLVAVLLALYPLLPYAPYASHVLRTFFRDTDQAFYAYYAAVFLSIGLFIGPAVVLSGATLPLLFDHLRRQVADLGAVAGRLYSWNTLGSLLGALGGGYAFLFVMDLHQVYGVALAALIGAALVLGERLGDAARNTSRVLFVACLVVMLFQGDWDPLSLAHGPFRMREPGPRSYAGADAYLQHRREIAEILFYEDDPVASIAVTEREYPDGGLARSIINNGKSDGNTWTDYTTMSLAAILPALLAERAERGFVIGFGTGVTVGELIVLPTVERVVVSEISPAVMKAAPLFDFANQQVMESPKVEVVRSDAYRALLRSKEDFDVIVSEPSNPWVQGVEMLFSREFLTAARDRLRPGGVYAQWYHQYETDRASLTLVLRTYAEVFDRVSVWYGLGSDLIILGFQSGTDPLDLDRLEARARSPVFQPGLERSGIGSFTELLAHELLPLGVVHAANLEGRVHTLFEPILGYTAARAFYRGQRAELPFTGFSEAAGLGKRNSLLGRTLARATTDELFAGLCGQRQRECVALLGRWVRASPGSKTTSQYVRDAARKSRLFGGAVTSDLVSSTARLYWLPGQERPTRPVSVAAARRASEHYERFYTHAIPFSPRALLDLWERCREGSGQRGACQSGLSQARELVRAGATEG